METRYLTKNQMSHHPCRFILGIIGPSRELSPEINPFLLQSIEDNTRIGTIEKILPSLDFQNPPESYFREMGNSPLSTSIIILKEGGAHPDLHFLKRRTQKLETKFAKSEGQRTFNINPGSVSAYGVCLGSHKLALGRHYSLPWRHHNPLAMLFPSLETYYERIMGWCNGKLEPVGKAASGGKFPEYFEPSRVSEFEGLVRTLPKNDVSVELLSNVA